MNTDISTKKKNKSITEEEELRLLADTTLGQPVQEGTGILRSILTLSKQEKFYKET